MRKVSIVNDVATGVVHSGDIQYTINVHCTDRNQTILAAFEWAAIQCNRAARAGKLKNGETYQVTPWGDVHKTDSQIVSEMSAEQKARLLAALQADQKQAKKAA